MPTARSTPQVALVALLDLSCVVCESTTSSDPPVSSRAYRGHETDVDQLNLVRAYPAIVGTRLDDCQTCHRSATLSMEKNGQQVPVFKNPCDTCHLYLHPDDSLTGDIPTSYAETLNPYGDGADNAQSPAQPHAPCHRRPGQPGPRR